MTEQTKTDWDAKVDKLANDSKNIIEQLVPTLKNMVTNDEQALAAIQKEDKKDILKRISVIDLSQAGGKSKRRRRRTGGTRKAGKGKSGKKH